MKPPKLSARILSALELQPMTLRQLCTVLTSPYPYTRNMLSEMQQSGMVASCGGVKRSTAGRPEKLYVVNSASREVYDPYVRPCEVVPVSESGGALHTRGML